MSALFQSVKENLSFLGVVLLIFLALTAVAVLAERAIGRGRKRQLGSARSICVVAMCAALSGLLMLLEIPLFFAPEFYKIDLSELPVLFCGFYLGPVAGVVCELLKVLVKLLLKGTTTAFVGDFANFAVGCALVLPATILYYATKTKKGAVAGLVTGTLIMTVFGSGFNALYLLPKFSQLYGIPMEALVGMGQAVNPAIDSIGKLVLFAVVPLNILKGVLVSVLTFLLYKRVEHVIFKRVSPAKSAAPKNA